jgi:hypothetical protein
MEQVSSGSTHVRFENADGSVLGKRTSWEGQRRTSNIVLPVDVSVGAGAGAKAGNGSAVGTENVSRYVEGGGVALGKAVPSIFGGSTAVNDFDPKPLFDRTQSWKREDRKRELYQQERLMEMERRGGKNFGYESASEDVEA